MSKKSPKKADKGRVRKKPYQKPKCTSEESFGSLILGCSFTDCGANSAFK